MKKLLVAFVIAVLGTGFAAAAGDSDYYAYSYARLSYVQGDVFIDRGVELGYEEGIINLPLVAGEKVGTRDGRAEIHFGRRNYLRLDRSAQLDIVQLPIHGSDLVKLNLLSGSIYLRIRYLAREKDFEIHTPDASFYFLEEGLYRLDVRENRETDLAVIEGAVEAAGEEGSLLVAAEERLVAADGYLQRDYGDLWAAYEDSFARWNRSRDELYARSYRRTYLPEELYEYEGELADHGRWVYESPYGYVWMPHVYQVSWRPYHYGRWVWYPVIGWNWVSYEPWGWSVYHYGRWHWRLGLGWYWIPTRHWGPAWVHWYAGYDYIGWCPLSYYNYPVVIINNRFYGQYSNIHYPMNSWALTVVHKRQLQAPQISKVSLSQGQMAKLGKVSLSPRQPNMRPLANASSLRTSVASKVLSRSMVRPVEKAYSASPGVRSLNRVNATKVKRSASIDSGARNLRKNSTTVQKSGTISPSRLSSRSQPQTSSSAAGTRQAAVFPSRSLQPKEKISNRSSVSAAPRASRNKVQSSVKRESGNRSSPGVKSYTSRSSISKGSSSTSATAKGRSREQLNRSPSRSISRYSPRSSSGLGPTIERALKPNSQARTSSSRSSAVRTVQPRSGNSRSYVSRSTAPSTKSLAPSSRSSSVSLGRGSSRSFSSSQPKASTKSRSLSTRSYSAPRVSQSSSKAKASSGSASSRSTSGTKVKKK